MLTDFEIFLKIMVKLKTAIKKRLMINVKTVRRVFENGDIPHIG